MVHSGVLDANSGGGVHTYELFKNFQSMGQVTCFIAESKQYSKLSGIVNVPFINKPFLVSISYYISLFFLLMNYSLKNNPSIFYVRKSTLGLSPLILSKILRIPYVLEINGLIDDEIRMLKNSPKRFTLKIFFFIDSFHFKYATKLITVTQRLKDQIIQKYGIPAEKIIFIENGMNPDDFYPIERTTALLKLNLDTSKKYVCFVGGLAPWHGVEYLIQSANGIITEFPEILFLIIGDGPMKTKIIHQIEFFNLSKKFILTGNIEHSLIPYYINASELCVAPFTEDRNLRIGLSPLKIFEYLSCGKPVVASNIPGVSEIILKSGGGILVKPNNPLELQKAIIELLKDEEMRTRMGQIGRKYTTSNYSWSNTAERIYNVFTNLLKN